MSAPQATLAPGDAVLGKYEVVGQLTATAALEIFNARHLILGREILLAVLSPAFANTECATIWQEGMRALSKSKARGVADVYEVFEVKGRPAAAIRRLAHLQFHRGSRRSRYGDHSRHSRRRSHQ